MSIKGFKLTDNSVEQYDYNYLDNIPELDTTLTSTTKPAQGKAAGEIIKQTINSIEYIPINNLENTNIYYIDGSYRFVPSSTRLSFGRSLITLKKGDVIECNLKIRVLNADIPEIYTVFNNYAAILHDGRYYILIHDESEGDISQNDITYLTVSRIINNGFAYGGFVTLNTATPVFVNNYGKTYISTPDGINVKKGAVVTIPNCRAIASFAYSDSTFEYFGFVNGKITAQKDGKLYIQLPAEYFGTFLNGIDSEWYAGSTTDGKRFSANNDLRVSGYKKELTIETSGDRSISLYTSPKGDTGWLSQSYFLEFLPGSYTERKNDNTIIGEPTVENYSAVVTFDNIYAHRGMTTLAPENTLAALLCAKVMGYGGTEFDVRFTADGIPVIIHDATINRTARTKSWGTVPGEIYVEDVTYNDLITNYYFDGTFKAKQNIPTLEQYISLSKMLGMKCYLEVAWASKADYSREQVELIVNIVRKYSYLDKTVFISFKMDYLKYIADIYPEAKIGYITMSMSDQYITDVLNARQSYPNLGLSYGGNDDALSLKCLNAGIPLYANSDTNNATTFRGEILILDGYLPRFTA